MLKTNEEWILNIFQKNANCLNWLLRNKDQEKQDLSKIESFRNIGQIRADDDHDHLII